MIGPDTSTRTAVVNLTVGTTPDFALTGLLALKGVLPGTSGSNVSIGVEAVTGFNGTVTLGVSGLPTGMTASFSPTSVSGAGAATLTFSVGANTAVGSYPITIAGTSGSLSHSYTMTFNMISKDYSIQPQYRCCRCSRPVGTSPDSRRYGQVKSTSSGMASDPVNSTADGWNRL